ncbi:hypothetical protein [Gimesia fumaroli]|uniref:Uncharacterized protein n=1 Tax=Gimesia fumaroli TaxID=2527976 RepID=A0A518IKB6_9PLAN|nr:hypothetical protein [Gimesia fumaroli]QDV53514.1 hypothetical protein Enr17x_55890 [Gimesia fumaroli]
MDMPPFPWLKDKPDTFQFHLENDTGDIETYTRKNRLDLGESLLNMRRIYLDTKYWLFVRDVYLNRSQNPLNLEIVNQLRRLRKSGSTICPISFSIFSELMYQSDPVTRNATAEMIDEFSEGTTIRPLSEVFKAELMHLMTRCYNQDSELYEIGQLVWTKVVYVAGGMHLSLKNSPIPPKLALAFQKSMFDFLWSIKLSEMIEIFPLSDGKEQKENIKLSEILTKGKFEHQASEDTFEKLFIDEVAGTLDHLSETIGDYTVEFARRNGAGERVSKEVSTEGGELLKNLIFQGFKEKKIKNEFPTIEISCSLHAAVRLDAKRKFKKGDVVDFHHATLALPYFDIFLTEASLQHLLQTKEIDAEKKYGCKVLSSEQEVLDHLRGLD